MTDDNHIDLTRRKVLGGIGAIGVASAGAGLGTSAYFNDEESFENNVLTAGELNLLVDYYSYWDQGMAGSGAVQGTRDGSGTVSGELTDVKPGDSGLLAFCPRIVDNPAYLWVCGELTANDENSVLEPEAGVDPNNTSVDPGADIDGDGELAQRIQVAASYCDLDGDIGDNGGFEPSDIDSSTEVWTGTLAAFLTHIENGVPLDGQGAEPSGGGFFAPGSQSCYAGTAGDDSTATNPCLCIEWSVPTDVGNEIQSDSLAFDLEFHAMQCRHNDGTTNPCAGDNCAACSFDTSATRDGASNLLSVGPDPSSGFPAIDARVRVDSPDGNAGDLTASDFAVCEDDCGQTIESLAFEPGGLADIVIVFDDTGSMGNEISTLQSKVNDLTDDIETNGIDARYALVSFKDEAELDQDFTDASTLKTAVDNLYADGGNGYEEDNLDAVAVGTGNAAGQDGAGASLSPFRSGAQRILIDITDAGAHEEGDHGYDPGTTRFSQSEIEAFLDDGNFTYYAVSPSSVDSGISKRDIANNVDDGTWIDIESADFSVILNNIVSSITDPAYVISYTTTNAATDGSTRTVNLQIDDPDEGLLYEEGTYTAPS